MAESLEVPGPTGDAADILAILQQTRAALLLSVPSSELVYTSRLLKVCKNHLLIDQLVPTVGDQLLQQGVSLRLRFSHQGIGYRFGAQQLGSGVDQRGFPFHRISCPAEVESEDKRANFRIQLRRTESPDCRITLGPEQTCHARLEDLSEGGARLRMLAEQAPAAIGSAVNFSVELDDLGQLLCPAKVCYLQAVPRSNQTRVGLAFRPLSRAETKHLRRIVMTLQRHNIRTGFTT